MSVERKLEALAGRMSEYVVHKSDFKTGKKLGRGGFSTVYAAVRRSTGMVCALKVLTYKNLTKERFQLYEREVCVIAACANPFSLRFVGFTIKRPFTIATEYVPNGTLYDAIRPKKSSRVLSGTELTIIALGIAYAMRRLHELDIVHRDLKSTNILLDGRWRPKICDFGLSRWSERKRDCFMTGHVGTTHWMAPELLQDGLYDGKVDVYSYAMVLFEMLTGCTPFADKTLFQIEHMVVYQGLRPPLPSHTPSGLRDLITRCWDTDPQKRPSFDEVFAGFTGHQAFFAGCDAAAIDTFLEEIFVERPVLINKDAVGSFDLPEELRADVPEDVLGTGTAVTIPVPDVMSANFEEELKLVAMTVSQASIDDFFTGMTDLLKRGLPAAQLTFVYTALVSIFERDRVFVKKFTDVNLHSILPFDSDTASPDLGLLLIHIFSYQPEAVHEDLLCKVGQLIKVMPRDVLKLYNLYVTYDQPLPFRDRVYDSIFSRAEEFMQDGASCQFVQQLDRYFTTDESFRSQYGDRVFEVFRMALSIADVDAKELLIESAIRDDRYMVLFQGLKMDLFLMDRSLYRVTLELFNKYTIPFDKPVIIALLCNGQTIEGATQILVRRCRDEVVAVATAELIDRWVTAPLPTWGQTVQLILAVLEFNSATEIVVNSTKLPMLLLELGRSGQDDLIVMIRQICKKLPISEAFVDRCGQSGFLTEYYRFALTSRNAVVLAEAFGLTEILARIKFSDDYLLLVPILKKLIEIDAWRVFAVALLATLSIYDEARPLLTQEKIADLIKPFHDDENLSKYVACFMKHVAKGRKKTDSSGA
jgi:serine/threonine protein kinase